MKNTFRYIITVILLSLVGMPAVAQDTLKSSHFSVYVLAGPNFYHNNWAYAKQDVNTVNFNLAGRFMWEPGHRLSVGINTGYYKIYTADVKALSATGLPTEARFRLVAIPIQLIMKMDLYKGLYAFYGMGPSLCYNNIFASKGNKSGELTGSWISPADITIAIGYQARMKDSNFYLGGELNFFHSSKSKENIIATTFVVGYRL